MVAHLYRGSMHYIKKAPTEASLAKTLSTDFGGDIVRIIGVALVLVVSMPGPDFPRHLRRHSLLTVCIAAAWFQLAPNIVA